MSATDLLEALPYIREFHGKTVVIKYGGAAMTDPALREEFARDVVLLKYVGLNPIVVHGGGPDITAYMERLNMPVEFIGGLRVSDADTVEIAKMVLVGKVNKDIVLRINRHGQPAVGLCGDDGQLFRVSTMTAPGGEDIGFVGRIERVDAGVIDHIAEDYIPVIASVGADRDGRSHNVNADEAAGAIARALGAYKVIFLTDVSGWLRDPADPDSVISETTADEVEAALDATGGGMRPKLEACLDAIHGGVTYAHIVDGRVPHSLLLELFTDAGHRHEDAARAVITDSDTDGQLRAVPSSSPRGAGCVLTDADGDAVPRLPGRDRGQQHRPLPPARRRGGAGAGRAADARLEPVLHRAEGALAERLARARSAARCSSATRARRPTRRRSSSCARRARGGDVVVAHGAFHGRTYGALSATPQETKQAPFAPLVPGFTRRRRRASVPDAGRRRTARGDDRARAGRVGRAPAAAELLAAIRAACDEPGAALVFDEVQTGMGRTGTLWAYEQTGVVPDPMTAPRASAAGFRSARWSSGPSSPTCSRPATTARRSPAARSSRPPNAALDVIDDPAFLAACASRASACAKACARCPKVRYVRGRGLMVAADVDADAPEIARRALTEQRMIINATGPATLRFLPPLVITADEVGEALRRLAALLACSP